MMAGRLFLGSLRGARPSLMPFERAFPATMLAHCESGSYLRAVIYTFELDVDRGVGDGAIGIIVHVDLSLGDWGGEFGKTLRPS